MAEGKRGGARRSQPPAKPVSTFGEVLKAITKRPLSGSWEDKDKAHLIRLIKKYGHFEVFAATIKLPPNYSSLVREFSLLKKDLFLWWDYQNLLFKHRGQPNPGYKAAADLFEQVKGGKPSDEEVLKFQDVLTKQFRRAKERREQRSKRERKAATSSPPGDVFGIAKRPPFAR